VDVLAATVHHWEDMLSKDVDVIIAKNQQNEREALVKTWMHDDRRMGLWKDQVSGATLNKGMPRDLRQNLNNNKWRSTPRYW
jgi:hypothetical protein